MILTCSYLPFLIKLFMFLNVRLTASHQDVRFHQLLLALDPDIQDCGYRMIKHVVFSKKNIVNIRYVHHFFIKYINRLFSSVRTKE